MKSQVSAGVSVPPAAQDDLATVPTPQEATTPNPVVAASRAGRLADPVDRGFELYCEAHGIDLRDDGDDEEAMAQQEREFAEEARLSVVSRSLSRGLVVSPARTTPRPNTS